jgi:hypothetical protein
MSISKLVPSGSIDGAPVKIAATASAGTTFHTSHASALDEITMWLSNTDSVDRAVTVEFGGATAPDFNMKFIVPAGDTILALAGLVLTNSKTCKAFAAAANVVNMAGYVNRIS